MQSFFKKEGYNFYWFEGGFLPSKSHYDNNEIFIPVGYGLAEIKLFIFDRWGVQIFKSQGEVIGWDGKNKGKLCEQDVYVYQADIKTISGKKIKRIGHVTLLPRVH